MFLHAENIKVLARNFQADSLLSPLFGVPAGIHVQLSGFALQQGVSVIQWLNNLNPDQSPFQGPKIDALQTHRCTGGGHRDSVYQGRISPQPNGIGADDRQKGLGRLLMDGLRLSGFSSKDLQRDCLFTGATQGLIQRQPTNNPREQTNHHGYWPTVTQSNVL